MPTSLQDKSLDAKHLVDGLVRFKCTHLVSVAGPDGTRHHILFNPTQDTVKNVYAWLESGEERGIQVEDRAGIHVLHTPAFVLTYTQDYGSMVLTTSC